MIRSPDFIPRKNSLSADPGQLLTPDLLKMPKQGLQKAELVNTSHEMYGDGLEAAKEFLASRNSPYTIDEELSTRDAIVATDEQGGDREVPQTKMEREECLFSMILPSDCVHLILQHESAMRVQRRVKLKRCR